MPPIDVVAEVVGLAGDAIAAALMPDSAPSPPPTPAQKQRQAGVWRLAAILVAGAVAAAGLAIWFLA